MAFRHLVKSKILFKGLAFILIPCAIDTVFCMQLLYLMAKTEATAQKEHTHMEIVRHANSILSFYAAASGQFGNYATTGAESNLQEGHYYEKKLAEEFDKLLPLIADTPQIVVSTKKYRDQGQDMLNRLEKIGRARHGNFNDEGIVDAVEMFKQGGIREFITNAGATSKTITNLAFQQEAALEQERLKQSEDRARITDGLRLLIGVNLLFALIMGALFLYDITRRLSVLVQNAQLLPKNLPLNEKVSGADELSYLDTVLHDAADELRNASEQRRYLMEMVAHDIRSPLMSSQVSLEVLSDERIGELPAMANRQIDALSTNIKRVIALTTDLLEVDKLEVDNMELDRQFLDISSVVEENILGLAELAKQKNITIVNECPHIKIVADRLRLGQVITNITSNAIKFSPADQWIRILATTEKTHLTVSIIDNGPGIAKKHQQKIFEKYAQLENGAGKGFGLGLAICKLIVTAHKGAIGVTNEEGAGARFWIRLPLPTDHYLPEK